MVVLEVLGVIARLIREGNMVYLVMGSIKGRVVSKFVVKAESEIAAIDKVGNANARAIRENDVLLYEPFDTDLSAMPLFEDTDIEEM